MDLATIGFRAETSGLVRARSDLDRLADQGERTEKRVSGAMGGIGKAFAAIASVAGVGSLASKLIETERSTGVLTASLKVATGSAQNASEAFGAIQRLATQLPESVDSVSSAFIKLTNLGLDPSEAAIKSYSNAAAAMGKGLNQMIEAVADAATGEFERLKEFGIKSKQQGDQVSFTFRGITTTVAKEADAITGYLRQIGDVTFAGAATERMKTLDGAISNIGDTWDGLFRGINRAGVGKLIADGVRMATGAIQSLSDFIESGQAAGAIEAFKIKFKVVGDVAVAGFNVMLDAAKGFYGAWYMMSNEFFGLFGGSTDSMIDKFVDGFVNLPENIKAFVQIMAIEIATLVEKAKVYGGQIAWHMNPANWFSEAPDISGAIDSLNMIREESIAIALQEREASIKSFQDQVKAVSEMTLATENAGEVLGRYGIKAAETATATGEITKQLKSMKDAVSRIELAEFDSFNDALGKENKSWEAVAKQKEELDALIESVDNFGGAWTSSGNTIADALGSMADQMDNYIARLDAVKAKELELAEEKKKAYSDDDIARITKAENKMIEERTRTSVSGYRAMAGAAASMFSENSKGRKALTAVEQAMTAIELALSLKRGLMAAKEAVLTQGKGDPYTAWARMAAMAAAVAALGFAVGGGGGGGGTSAADVQGAQGTGSVLGSNDKSESILKSMESFNDVGIDQLVELRGIREGLSGFTGGIEQLSMSFATSKLADQKYFAFQNQSFGHAMNVGLEIGGSKKEHTAMRAALAPMQDEITNVLGFMAETVTSGVKSLGLEFERSIWDYWINIGKVSFEGMSGEEINQELNAIFSQQADLLTSYLIPSLQEYQQMGEGLFETLTRVAKEQAIFNDTIKNIGLDLGDLSAIMRIDVAQSVIQLMGGLEEFSDKTSEYFDSFFTESEKMDMLAASLSEAFGALNITLPKSDKEFRALVEGIDLTTDAGQRMFANLMELAPGVDDYVTGLEKAAEAQAEAAQKALDAEQASLKAAKAAQEKLDSQRTNLQIQLLTEMGMAEEALTMKRQIELAAIDESLRSLQEQIYAQQDLNKASAAAAKAAEEAAKIQQDAANETLRAQQEVADKLAEIASERYGLETQLLQASGDVAALRARELELLDESNRPLQQMIWALQDQKEAAELAAQAEQERLTALEEAEREQNRIREEGVNEARRIAEEQKRLIEGTQNSITAAIKALRGESEELNDIDRQRAKNTLSAALAAAQAGKSIIGFAGLEDALMAVQKIDKSQFQSAEAYQREVGQTLSILDRLGGYAGIAPKTPTPTTSPVVPMGNATQAQTTQQLAVNMQNMEAQMLDLTKRIEKNTKTNADLLQRWEAIGMPATRA